MNYFLFQAVEILSVSTERKSREAVLFTAALSAAKAMESASLTSHR